MKHKQSIKFLQSNFMEVGEIFLAHSEMFYLLAKNNDQYIWNQVQIDNLPYIPIYMDSLSNRCINFGGEKKSIILNPIFCLYPNGKRILPAIKDERIFDLNTKTETTISTVNPYFYNLPTDITEKNIPIIKWNNMKVEYPFCIYNNEKVKNYIETHQEQLEEFKELYNQSLKTLKKVKVKRL